MGNQKSKKPYDINHCIFLSSDFKCNNKEVEKEVCPYKDKCPFWFCDGYVEKDLDGN